MKTEKTTASIEFAGKILSFETGELAQQATSSILARCGDTVVLVTVVEGRLRDDIDYFPLSVEYVEKLYAGGRIKGSRWVKREGRPTDDAILTGRLIDRSIRPLFPKEYRQEVQVVATVLSVDGENAPDILALNAVSAALTISPIPWNGPIGGIRMGYIKETEGNAAVFLPNPTTTEAKHSELDIVVSQSNDLTLMIEAGALQVQEEVLVEAIKQAHTQTKQVLKLIEELLQKVGQKKKTVVPDARLQDAIKIIEQQYKDEVKELLKTRVNKEGSGSEMDDLLKKVYENVKMANPDTDLDKKILVKAIEYVMFKLIRSEVVGKQNRPDGRKIDEIREISTSVSVLPRTHGSALFQRGLTQALTIVTLGSPRMEQLIESAEGEESKRYIHHYSGPPYSLGEAGRMGSPSRREIGHGALAERALEAVIPSQSVFPYTIRLVSEVLSQNGSSSMASTCGSTLALMDAGVPILKPVAGISIGRMSEGDKSVLLTDIIGLEDFSGDMDFKVAGTDTGVTAIQLDVKIPGLKPEEIAEILTRAKTARLQILENILSTLPEARKQLSLYAPKIETLKIPVDKIGELIGPGGKVIKNIIAQTGATVDVEDDGTVTISGIEDEAVKKAMDWVSGMMREVTVGETFEGPVKRILPFGAFVEILPGKEGMVHVSKMAQGFVNNPEEVVKVGQEVKVKVLEIDEQGRINLTMLLDGGMGGGSGSSRPQPERREAQSPHPLSQQLQRERGEKRFSRDNSSRPVRKRSHF